MMQEIINITQYGDALRNTGYKNIESAVSEIIDNSLEAQATDTIMLVTETIPAYAGKKHVTEIAFLDNGTGMDAELLQSCLRIGYGTHGDRRGMGRFGVGLPQASLHVCPLVEVYSWQQGIKNCRMSYLDIYKIKNGEQKGFENPPITEIPEKYKKYINFYSFGRAFDFSVSGTLVVWKDCDNVKPVTVKPLYDRLEFELGRKFRHLIENGSRKIYLLHADEAEHQHDRQVLSNDPLYLMPQNVVLGDVNQPGLIGNSRNNNLVNNFTVPFFEPFKVEMYPDGVIPFKIKYFDRNDRQIKDGVVHITFSIIKKEFYNRVDYTSQIGSSAMGKHMQRNKGISVVRAGREIDFGTFDFYSDENMPVDRWWGCEISFDPVLDEVFNVSNNKQHVELIELSDEEFEDEDVKPVWLQLKHIISTTIKAMRSRNAQLQEGTKSKEIPISPTEKIINAVEQNAPKSFSETVREQKDEGEIRQHIKEVITILDEEPTEEEVSTYLLNKVSILYKSANPAAPFFYYESSMGVCICTINIDHIFYKNFMNAIDNNPDNKIAFELFIASLIRTIDETTEKRREAYDYLVTEWNEKLRKYIDAQVNGTDKEF